MTQPATFGTTPNVYRYTSQQVDSATGLYDLRARYYNPGEGRFLSQDTWPLNSDNPNELNKYVYSVASPINFDDPTGHSTIIAGYAQTTVSVFKVTPALVVAAAIVALLLFVLIVATYVVKEHAYDGRANHATTEQQVRQLIRDATEWRFAPYESVKQKGMLYSGLAGPPTGPTWIIRVNATYAQVLSCYTRNESRINAREYEKSEGYIMRILPPPIVVD